MRVSSSTRYHRTIVKTLVYNSGSLERQCCRERPTRTIMTGRQNARDMLEEAERSAIAGDLARPSACSGAPFAFRKPN